MHTTKTQKGSILVFALIMLSFILITAFTVAGVTLIERRSTTASVNSATAFQNADKGMEEFLQQIYKSMDQSSKLSELADSLDEILSEEYKCVNGAGETPAYIGTVKTEFMISAYKEGAVAMQPFTGWNGANLEPIVDCNEVLANVSRFKVVGNHKSAARAVFVKLRDSLMRGLVAHWSFEDRAQVANLSTVTDKSERVSHIAQDASKNDHTLTLCRPEDGTINVESSTGINGVIKEFDECKFLDASHFMSPMLRGNCAEECSADGSWDKGVVRESDVDGGITQQEALYFNGEDYLAMYIDDSCTINSKDVVNCVDEEAEEDKLKLADGITISLWMKANASAARQELVARYDETNKKGYHIYMDNVGKICFGLNDKNVCTAAEYDNDKWHHVVGRWQKPLVNGDSFEIIVDDVIKPSGIDKVDRINYGNDLLYVGATKGSSNFFKGTIDDMRIWNRKLMDEEINRLCVSAQEGADVSSKVECLEP